MRTHFLIASKEQHHGAMENWGLIMLSSLLLDASRSSCSEECPFAFGKVLNARESFEIDRSAWYYRPRAHALYRRQHCNASRLEGCVVERVGCQLATVPTT